ncbi:MAG TPA: dicarboxylate/amino acid:cation symporter [Sedimentibacter sp.]|jgi:Na+/H+-dicarboxylate symporter|nr:dicarboxylate/amino acid:cation symporter [Sedimentibacter sp.]HPV85037.1 dicarboxylate/amino acid:cation symporter [Sedimentibacter sp.]HQC70097.1 dicarboxylate/amino acid:cation symporter [Sedimentibacter sp.]HQO72895.1 dicarboxylate/amino acid:cation symporter [Sedimentibacter sp.]HQO95680.1 dicarboxylate/amino acid:cation symporter [Sedimentibacter sp.]
MSTSKKTVWENYRFSVILIISIAIGSFIGLVFGDRAVILKPFGDIFLNLMFTAVTPLVFVTIASAVGSMVNMRRLGRILGNMLLVFVITGLFAAVLIIFVVSVYPPAEGVNIQIEAAGELEKLTFADQAVSAITVNDFSKILSRSNMLPLIVFSILFGYCVSAVGGEDNIVARALDALSKVMMKFISVIMLYAPIGLGAYFASLIGEFGPQLLGAYARAMVVYYPLCVFYFFVFFALYTYYSGGMEAVKSYFKNIVEPSVTSIATQSSIATLPTELRAAQRIGVPKDIRDIILPIGATAHMDGTVLSSILKISFLFGIFGQEFAGIGTYLTAIGLSILGGVVMSGVPGGGLIGEMLIVNMYGFPPEAFPIIATIGFLVDPPATWLNSTGDTVAAMMVTRIIEGKDWMAKKLTAEEEII